VFDQSLHPPPKTQLVQWIVTPTWDVRKQKGKNERKVKKEKK